MTKAYNKISKTLTKIDIRTKNIFTFSHLAETYIQGDLQMR